MANDFFQNPWTQVGAGILAATQPGVGASEAIGRGIMTGLQSQRRNQEIANRMRYQDMLERQQQFTMDETLRKRQQQEATLAAQRQHLSNIGRGTPSDAGPMQPTPMERTMGQIGATMQTPMTGDQWGNLLMQNMQAQQQQQFAQQFPQGLPRKLASAYPQVMATQAAQSLFPEPPPVTQINVAGDQAPSMGTEKAMEYIGKGLDTRMTGYRERARTAQDFQSSLNRFAMAMERAENTGGLEATKKTLREWGARFGFPIDEQALAKAQDVDMAAKMMVADQLRLNAGPQTDFDARFSQEYLPGLATTKEANQAAVDYASSVNRLRSLFGTEAANVAQFEPGQTPDLQIMNERMTAVDQLAGSTPAVVLNPQTGQWVQFEDFYRRKRKKGEDNMQILTEWRSISDWARGQ